MSSQTAARDALWDERYSRRAASLRAFCARPLLREEFELWLESLPPLHPVGERAGCHVCPLASWLKTRIKDRDWHEDLEVDGEQWTLMGWYPQWTWPLPEWAREFVRLVDEGTENSVVSARTCLRILRLVEVAEQAPSSLPESSA